MQQCCQPGAEEYPQLPALTLGQIRRQQAVGPQQRHAGQHQSAHAGQIEPLHLTQPDALCRRLPSPLDGIQHQSAGDHGAADQTTDEIQPAHGVTAKLGKMQPRHHFLHQQTGAGRRRRAQQLAGDRIEGQRLALGQLQTTAKQRPHLDPRIDAARLSDRQRRQHAGTVMGFAQGNELLQRQHDGARRRHLTRWPTALAPARRALLLLGTRAQLAQQRIAIAVVQRIGCGRHVDQEEDHQTGVGNHQMERQQQHGAGVVTIQPAALALARAEGKEVLEDFLMDENAADNRHQHRHRSKPDDPDTEKARHMQGVMETEEETASCGLSRRYLLAALSVDQRALATPLFARRDAQRGIARRRQADIPGTRRRMVGFQPALGNLHGTGLIDLPVLQFRLHPPVQLPIKHRQGAGQKDRKQQPAEHQAGPGVQRRHRLGQ